MNKRFIFILFSCFGDCFHLGKYIWLTAYYNGTCFDCVVTFIFCYQCVLSCVLVLASQAQLTCKWSRNWFVSTEVMNTFPSLFPSFSLFWCGNISALANLLQCNLSDSFSLNIHHIRLLGLGYSIILCCLFTLHSFFTLMFTRMYGRLLMQL